MVKIQPKGQMTCRETIEDAVKFTVELAEINAGDKWVLMGRLNLAKSSTPYTLSYNCNFDFASRGDIDQSQVTKRRNEEIIIYIE